MSHSARSLLGIILFGVVCVGAYHFSSNAASSTENVDRRATPVAQLMPAFSELSDVPEKMRTYQQNRKALVELVQNQVEAYGKYQDLLELTPAQIASTYPDGQYDIILADAIHHYLTLRGRCVRAQAIADASLAALSGGRPISQAALIEFHAMQNL